MLQWNMSSLRKLLESKLSLEELKSTAFDLGIDYEGVSKGELVRKLLKHVISQEKQPTLIGWLEENRPDIDIHDLLRDTHLDESPALDDDNSIRARIIRKTRTERIEKNLKEMLNGAEVIRLFMEARPDLVSNTTDDEIDESSRVPEIFPVDTSIVTVFKKYDRELLILGEPGAGKTILVLLLLSYLLDLAELDGTQPIPIYLLLSSLGESTSSLSEWVVDELRGNVSPDLVRDWIKRDQLVLILDGLDEVKPEHRKGCIEKINDFLCEHGASMIVSVRPRDYLETGKKLNLTGAVLLQQVNDEQLASYLKGSDAGLTALRQDLMSKPHLREMAKNPLSLSIMRSVYMDFYADEGQQVEIQENNQRSLISRYTTGLLKPKEETSKPLNRRKRKKDLSPDQMTRWLSWLANNMAVHGQTEFYLERLQPDWLDTAAQHREYSIVCQVTVRLIFGMICGSAFYPAFGILGGVGGFFFGFLFSRIKYGFKEIRTVEVLGWSSSRLRAHLGESIRDGLLVGLVFGIFWYLAVQDLKIAAIITLLSGTAHSLVFLILSGLQGGELETRLAPNQGIKRSARLAVLSAMLGASATVLVFGLVWSVYEAVIGGTISNFTLLVGGVIIQWAIVGAINGSLYNGALAVLQHFVLRIILWLNGAIPLDYVRFLNQAESQRILYGTGAGYRFSHQLIQQEMVMREQPLPPILTPRQIWILRGAALSVFVSIVLFPIVAVWSDRESVMAEWDYKHGLSTYNEGVSNPSMATSRYRSAIQQFTNAIQHNSSDYRPYVYRGIAQLRIGDYNHAAADLYAVANLITATEDPKDAAVLNELCRYGSLFGFSATVIYACNKAVELAPDDGRYYDSRGIAWALTGHPRQAIDDFSKFIEWSRRYPQLTRIVDDRRVWIKSLNSGNNPFDSKTLERLRKE